jgi:hypothetical protein
VGPAKSGIVAMTITVRSWDRAFPKPSSAVLIVVSAMPANPSPRQRRLILGVFF